MATPSGKKQIARMQTALSIQVFEHHAFGDPFGDAEKEALEKLEEGDDTKARSYFEAKLADVMGRIAQCERQIDEMSSEEDEEETVKLLEQLEAEARYLEYLLA